MNDTEWSSRFRKSLYAFRHLRNIATDQVERELDRICAKRHVSPDLLAAAVEALLEQHARKQVLGLIDQTLSVTESLLEAVMAVALLVAARERVGQVTYLGRSWRSAWTRGEIAIFPQAQALNYRVDFLLLLRADEAATGTERRLVVECDGHKFHERTPVQAATDRSRDRALQAAGFQVFRYAGSEIWADVFGCAVQAIETLIAAPKPIQNADGHENRTKLLGR